MVNKLSAYKTYLLFSAITAMCFSLVATVMIVYHIETVHLNPLQLILVGTTLEVACFIFEIPTGIVADVYSRKLSIVIGVVLTGVGFILEGSISSFVFVLVAQIVWGLGSTFISGSVEAWIAEEEKDKDLDKIYIKGIDIDGNEQNRDVYTVELEDDAILPKAYDGDESTFYLAGNAVTKNIEISKNVWNKQLNILSRGYQIVSFLGKDGNVLYKKTHRQNDTTYTIPENTTSMKYYFNESGGIYEMKIID